VIQGLEDVVLEMLPGQEVQALIPAALAYGTKGVCKEDGECLIPSNTNLKYFIRLKKIAILPS
jgi:FKBP-type peptidyl-prolyl cis-trans isomerase